MGVWKLELWLMPAEQSELVLWPLSFLHSDVCLQNAGSGVLSVLVAVCFLMVNHSGEESVSNNPSRPFFIYVQC